MHGVHFEKLEIFQKFFFRYIYTNLHLSLFLIKMGTLLLSKQNADFKILLQL